MEKKVILQNGLTALTRRKVEDETALAVGNLEFPLSVIPQMIRMYDLDRNGTMSFQEFVALNNFLLKVQHAFSDLERGRGFLVPDDVFEALVKIGFMLDSPVFTLSVRALIKVKMGGFGWMT